MTMGERIKQLRKEKGMTQTDLAMTLNVTKGTVSTWETNSRVPGFETLNALSDLFERRLDYIMGRSDDATPTTQNVDNLHEQAGSTRVLHLHGELMKLRSEQNPDLIYDINEGWEQDLNARGEDGALLRPHIVFFGESVPMFDAACKIVERADILVVVGTSLAVYPAAMLVYYVRDKQVPIYLVDPGTPDTRLIKNPLTHIKERGAVGLPQLVEELKNEFGK